MKKSFNLFLLIAQLSILNCSENKQMSTSKSASEILGNPDYPAFSFGGYREKSRDTVPSSEDLKEGLKVMDAMGIKILRTYNTQQYAHAANLLQAIHEMKQADESFEMYVMLGAWIDCLGAWTDNRNHDLGDEVNNKAEIDAAVYLANKYPDIVKIIAVGNEAMVHWAESYFVAPSVTLKWVNHLQDLKESGKLAKDIWITSSDNYASWGGGDPIYHNDDLTALMNAVDFISLHTYPYHDTHYNPNYWVIEDNDSLSELEKVEASMLRARDYTVSQYQSAKNYMDSIRVQKPIHIGETGWSSMTNDLYGDEGSRASDEYKQKLYYNHMRQWSDSEGISCFYFEMFDEQWKDANNPMGSENHFGLINLKGQAKYALWDLVDQGVFDGIKRNGYPITKTFNGDKEILMQTVLPPRTLELQ